jgi:putative ABC transport system substrate-binding protein
VIGPLGPDLDFKRLQLLAEAAPAMTKVLVLKGAPPISDDEWQAAAASLGLGYLGVRLHASDDIEAVLARAVAEGADGLLVQSGSGASADLPIILALAERHRLPDAWVRGAGGLVRYNPRQSEMERIAADYVDRILRGARPGDLPIQFPTRYDLVVDLRAARAIGLTVPPALLDQADQVIE